MCTVVLEQGLYLDAERAMFALFAPRRSAKAQKSQCGGSVLIT